MNKREKLILNEIKQKIKKIINERISKHKQILEQALKDKDYGLAYEQDSMIYELEYLLIQLDSELE